MKNTARQKNLLAALEKRLEALTRGLEDVEVQGKGIDLVKEIKELHHMLDMLQGEGHATGSEPARIIVVWGEARASSSAPARGAPRGTGRRTASAKAVPSPPRQSIQND